MVGDNLQSTPNNYDTCASAVKSHLLNRSNKDKRKFNMSLEEISSKKGKKNSSPGASNVTEEDDEDDDGDDSLEEDDEANMDTNTTPVKTDADSQTWMEPVFSCESMPTSGHKVD